MARLKESYAKLSNILSWIEELELELDFWNVNLSSRSWTVENLWSWTLKV